MNAALGFHCRWLIRRDMPEVLAVEDSTPDAWGEKEFFSFLRQQRCVGMVVEEGERVVGHMVYLLGDGEFSLVRLAVHPRHRRRGVGSFLVRKLASKTSSRRPLVRTRVSDRCLDAHLLLRANEFVAVRVERGLPGEADHYHFERRVE